MAEPTREEIDAVAEKIPRNVITGIFPALMENSPELYQDMVDTLAQEHQTNSEATSAYIKQVLESLEE